MDKLMDQLFWQMVMDIIRVIILVYAFGILIFLGECINRLEKFIGKLIVKGCKVIWRFIKKLFNRPEILVPTVESEDEV
ncbi:MAG: hypothetical protein EOM34_16830 [Clostridia bacterium]|nr:hypothetical protein [Clostridia bacterium]